MGRFIVDEDHWPSNLRHMNKHDVLRRHAGLKHLPSPVLDRLAMASRFRKFSRNEIVWRIGEPASEVVVVGNGLVRVSVSMPLHQSESGAREATLALVGPGETSALSTSDAHEDNAVCLTSTSAVAYVPTEAFWRALEMCPPAAIETTRMMGREAAYARTRAVRMTGAAENRLAAEIMDLAERFGDEINDGTLWIPIQFSRAELASMAGVRVETTIRELKRWKSSKILDASQEDGMRVLNPTEMRKIASGSARTEVASVPASVS